MSELEHDHPLTSVAEVSVGFRGRIINFFLRKFVKAHLSGMQQTPENVSKLRARFEKIISKTPAPKDDLVITDTEIAGVRVESQVSPSAQSGVKILYLHGGAFIAGSPRTHWPITRTLAVDTGYEVLSVDYRLAPEHPYPAAVTDVLDVYRAVIDETPAHKIVLAGDSAGGNLVLALLHAARAEGLAMPAAAVCLSPWTDLTGSSESVRDNIERDVMLPAARMPELARLYLAGAYIREPTASPLYGEFEGFPTLLFHVGDSEVLYDDSRRCVARARAAGVETHLRIWPNLPHVFHAFSPRLPVAREALHEIADFMQAKIAQAMVSL